MVLCAQTLEDERKMPHDGPWEGDGAITGAMVGEHLLFIAPTFLQFAMVNCRSALLFQQQIKDSAFRNEFSQI